MHGNPPWAPLPPPHTFAVLLLWGEEAQQRSRHSACAARLTPPAAVLPQEGLDAKVRSRKEAELAELQQLAEAQAAKEREKKLATKYHKVRFFERIKLERELRKLQKKQEQQGRAHRAESGDGANGSGSGGSSSGGGGGLSEADTARMAQLQADLQYVLHFPKGER